MGCAASKQQVQQVHPVSSAPTSAPADNKPAAAPAETQATVSTTQVESVSATAIASERGTTDEVKRHSAGSSKGLDKAVIPAIPGAAADTAAPVAASSASLQTAQSKPTAFEIPLDDTIKTRARKPASANPKRRQQLAPVSLSNEELRQKLAAAEAKWESSDAAGGSKPSLAAATGDDDLPLTEKEIAPEKLKAMIAEREERIAENRRRELEQKQAKLQQHDAHVKKVNERKQKMESVPGAPDMQTSWGGENSLAGGAEGDAPQRGSSIDAL
ncbi:hypothetical protein RI367_006318 [Sorochytrium milnesiophthora]